MLGQYSKIAKTNIRSTKIPVVTNHSEEPGYTMPKEFVSVKLNTTFDPKIIVLYRDNPDHYDQTVAWVGDDGSKNGELILDFGNYDSKMSAEIHEVRGKEITFRTHYTYNGNVIYNGTGIIDCNAFLIG